MNKINKMIKDIFPGKSNIGLLIVFIVILLAVISVSFFGCCINYLYTSMGIWLYFFVENSGRCFRHYGCIKQFSKIIVKRLDHNENTLFCQKKILKAVHI